MTLATDYHAVIATLRDGLVGWVHQLAPASAHFESPAGDIAIHVTPLQVTVRHGEQPALQCATRDADPHQIVADYAAAGRGAA